MDGWSNSIDIDLTNTGYLNSAFDGRSFSAWIKPVTDFYSGPAIVAHEDLVAYYTADEGSGTELSDLTTNNLHSDLEGGTAWIHWPIWTNSFSRWK